MPIEGAPQLPQEESPSDKANRERLETVKPSNRDYKNIEAQIDRQKPFKVIDGSEIHPDLAGRLTLYVYEGEDVAPGWVEGQRETPLVSKKGYIVESRSKMSADEPDSDKALKLENAFRGKRFDHYMDAIAYGRKVLQEREAA